jgi:hypothetical protein
MAPDPDPGIDGGEFLGWRQVETLGVADVVMSILEARKEMPWASAAAVSRQHRDNAIYVQVSLFESASASPGTRSTHQDGRIQLIAGFAARQLGEELVTAFGDKDVIILK